jgi:hypothetical protein
LSSTNRGDPVDTFNKVNGSCTNEKLVINKRRIMRNHRWATTRSADEWNNRRVKLPLS